MCASIVPLYTLTRLLALIDFLDLLRCTPSSSAVYCGESYSDSRGEYILAVYALPSNSPVHPVPPVTLMRSPFGVA